MEKMIYESLIKMRGHKTYEQFEKELKVLVFLAYKNNLGEISLEDVDMSDHSRFNEKLLSVCDLSSDEETSIIIKDIIVSGLIVNSNELNSVFRYLLNFNPNILKDFMDFLYEEKLNRSNVFDVTEDELAKLVYELSIKNNPETILDICSGQGNFLSQFKNNKEKMLYGYEVNPQSILLSKLRLNIHGLNYNLSEVNVLKTSMRATADFVFSEYPWGIRFTDNVVEDENNVVDYNIGKHRADWAFINKAINSTNENGTTVVLSPNGVLFSTPDGKIRQEVIEKKLLHCIISMPESTRLHTSAPYSILVFKRNSEKVHLLNCSECYVVEGKSKRTIDIDKILTLYNTSEENESHKIISEEEIRENNWNLSLSLYFKTNELPLLNNPMRLKELATILPGFQYTSKSVTELEPNKGEYDVVRISNIEDGEIDYNNLVSIDGERSKLERYLLKENDILIATKGTSLKLGLVTDLRKDKTIFNGNLSVIRVNSEKISPAYLYNYLNSDTGKTMLMMKRTGSIIMNISRNALQELLVPVEDKDIQEVIENRYYRLTAELKNIKRQVKMLSEKISKIYEEEVEG